MCAQFCVEFVCVCVCVCVCVLVCVTYIEQGWQNQSSCSDFDWTPLIQAEILDDPLPTCTLLVINSLVEL